MSILPRLARRALLLGALLIPLTSLGAAQAAGTPSGTITVVDRFSPQTVAAGAEATYTVEISNSGASALTGVEFPVDLSAMGLRLISGSSSCGGSLSVSAFNSRQGTWQGGVIPAAPQAQTPTICTFNVTFQARTGAGSFTTSFPAGAITTAQGLTNPSASAASITVTPLQRLITSAALSSPGSPEPVQGAPMLTVFTLENPNAIAVSGVRLNLDFTLSQALSLAPEATGCTLVAGGSSPAQLTADAQARATLQVISPTLARSGPIDLPPGVRCTLGLRTTSRMSQDTNENDTAQQPNNYGANAGIWAQESTNTTDPMLNSVRTPFLSVSSGFALGLSFNGTNSYNRQSDPGVPAELQIGAVNRTPVSSSLSLSLPIPADLGLSGAASVAPGSAPGCTTAGISLSPTAVTFSGVTLPGASGAEALCVYRFPVQTPPVSGVTLNLPASATVTNAYTSSEPAAPGAWSGRAVLMNAPALIAQARTQTNTEYSYSTYQITIVNQNYAPVSNLSFSDRWTHALRLGGAVSTSGCGAPLVTPDADGRGITFSGGTIAAASAGVNTSCTVILPIDPLSAAAGEYENTTSSVTGTVRGAGVSTWPAGGTNTYLPRRAKFTPRVTTVIQGVPGELLTRMINITGRPTDDTVELNLGGPGHLIPSGPPLVRCGVGPESVVLTGAFAPLSPGDYSVSGGTLRLRMRLPASTADSSYPPVGLCDLRLPVTPQVQVNLQHVVPTVRETSTGTPLSLESGYNAVSYQVAAPNTYAVNQTFTPQTVVGGASSTLRLNVTTVSGSVYDGYSDLYAEIRSTLPAGMQLFGAFEPNQGDGRYVSPDTAPYTDSGHQVTAGLPCLEISADRRSFVQRCRDGSYAALPVLITRYGDLIHTVLPAGVKPFYGQVTSPSSASAKATRGVAVTQAFVPASAKPQTPVRLNITLHNATADGDPPSTLSVSQTLPAGLVGGSGAGGAVPVSGNCAGASASFNAATRALVVSGVVLAAQAECTVGVEVRATLTPSAEQLLSTSVAPGGALASSGSTNPQAASAALSVEPYAQCVALTGAAGGRLMAGRSTALGFTLSNTGEGPLAPATVSGVASGSPAYVVSFGGAPGSTSPQTAWNNWLAANPAGLAPGETLSGAVTFTVSSGAPQGQAQAVELRVIPTGGTSCGAPGASIGGLVEPAPQGGVLKEQSRCADLACSAPQWTQAALPLEVCGVIAYRLSASGLGGTLYGAAVSSTWPALQWISARAQTTPAGRPVLWQVGGAPPSAQVPTGLLPGERLRVFADLDGNGALSPGDTLADGESLQVILIGRLAQGCAS